MNEWLTSRPRRSRSPPSSPWTQRSAAWRWCWRQTEEREERITSPPSPEETPERADSPSTRIKLTTLWINDSKTFGPSVKQLYNWIEFIIDEFYIISTVILLYMFVNETLCTVSSSPAARPEHPGVWRGPRESSLYWAQSRSLTESPDYPR